MEDLSKCPSRFATSHIPTLVRTCASLLHSRLVTLLSTSHCPGLVQGSGEQLEQHKVEVYVKGLINTYRFNCTQMLYNCVGDKVTIKTVHMILFGDCKILAHLYGISEASGSYVLCN